MTVHNLQGRGRLDNIIDLHNCTNHQLAYTALSRGFTYEGTAIIQGFDKKKIQGGISRHLRQESRELEVLDDIIHLAFVGKLPKMLAV